MKRQHIILASLLASFAMVSVAGAISWTGAADDLSNAVVTTSTPFAVTDLSNIEITSSTAALSTSTLIAGDGISFVYSGASTTISATGGSGLTSLNGSTSSTQTFATTTDGFVSGRITTANGTHTFALFSLLASSTWAKVANNLSDLASAATARTNLGLGDAATLASTTWSKVANNLSDLASSTAARLNLGLGDSATLASSTWAKVASNLTDLANTSTARTNLGIGTGDSPVFTGLSLSGITSGFLKTNGSGVVTTSTISLTTDISGVLALANGGSGTSTVAATNTIWISNGSKWIASTLAGCSGTSTDKLLYNTTTGAFTCGTDQTGSGTGVASSSFSYGTGISIVHSGPSSTWTNTGATSLASGTNISVSAATGSITVNYTGVTSTIATANGGTGTTTLGTNALVYVNGTATKLSNFASGTAGLVLKATSTAPYFSWETDLTGAGSGDSFTKLIMTNRQVVQGFATTSLPGMVFTYAANKRYVIDFYGLLQSPVNTTGVGLMWDVSNAVTSTMAIFHQLANAGTVTGGSAIQDNFAVGVSSGLPTASTTVPIFGGGILWSGAATGTAQLRIRSEITTASTTMMEGTMAKVLLMD